MSKKFNVIKGGSGKFVLLNLLGMAVVVSVIVLAVTFAANIYTRHGEAVSVPNVCDKNFPDAEYLLKAEGLNVVVSDTGYNRHLPPGYVLHQQPAAGTKVKNGRVVFLSINSSQKPTLVMPDIIDNSSLREATARLKMLGFNVGTPKYISGEKDWVYGVLCRGKQIHAGERVPVDALIVLQVGSGGADEYDDLHYIDPNISFEIDGDAGAEFEEDPSVIEEEDPFVIVE
jgi:hypothetical protein